MKPKCFCFSLASIAYQCNIAISPADSRNAIGVASTNVNEYISYYSSAGPANNHMEIKPGTHPKSDYLNILQVLPKNY